MHSYRCDISDGFHIPDLAEQLILAVYMVRMAGKNSIPAGCISLEYRCGIIPYHTYNLVRAYLLFGDLPDGYFSGCRSLDSEENKS